ncbi:MAG: Hpt domain-containing protein [Desulfovibrio sp.]|uniref:chemotaxis protein CheA n=1 Tax=Desulfovibrio sp. 7SRBS1 TaxID=3378064 RepID=UPI003B3CB923
MNQDFMDPEIFADFIVEAKEHLETIEPTLLELEKAPDNLSLLNDVFRPMHSLKGASGFLGLNKINGLAHKAENILDELRNGNIVVTTDIMDVILSATDALRSMIDSLEENGTEGDVDTDPIIDQIARLMAGEAIQESSGPEVAEVAAEEAAPVEENPEENFVEPDDDSAEDEIDWDAVEPGEQAVAVEDLPDLPPFEPETYKLSVLGEEHLTDFLEEAHENVQSLGTLLIDLEKDPVVNKELVNDIFRFFHNLKGNSGIIGYKELNSLTHEAETLLNKVRKDEMEVSNSLIDLALSAVDLIDDLVNSIDSKAAEVTPIDTRIMEWRLQRASEHGFLPEPGQHQKADDVASDDAPSEKPSDEPAAEEKISSSPATAKEPEKDEAQPADGQDGSKYDEEDVQAFIQANIQQLQNVSFALETLRKDSTDKDFIDGLFRSLVTIQNSSGYMGFDEIKLTAERTAGLVDQARGSDLDFSLMLDILEQECSILEDLVKAKFVELGVEPEEPAEKAGGSAETSADKTAKAEEKPVEKETPKESKPAPEKTPESPAVESKKAEKSTAVAEIAPVEPKPASKPAPKKAAPPAAKAAPQKSATKPAAPQKANSAPTKPKTSATIRVDHEKLDHLMNLIGELIINRNRFAMLGRSLEEGHLDVQEIAQNLIETTDSMNRISDDLQDTIMNVRMVPVGTVFSRFPRLVRDLSRKSGKQVELITEGEDTELDKSVVEVIGDPLVHMIRNSVDHGLENEEERAQTQKDPVGKVWLRAYHRGNSVAIEVEDDGKGIDPERIRSSALKKGLITQEQASQMDDREALELIFAPGFSSAEKVTDISGRGVGMDVVRSNIKNLKGSVSVNSELGKGTKVTLSLPLTLAIIDALMVMVSGNMYAIPLDAVSETTKLNAKRLTDVNSRKALELRGEVLGIIELSEVLDLPPNKEKRDLLPVVIINDNDRRLGIVVDRLLERQEIVIKPLGAYLNEFDLRGISGATIMGDGSVILILDPHEVYSMSSSLKNN